MGRVLTPELITVAGLGECWLAGSGSRALQELAGGRGATSTQAECRGGAAPLKSGVTLLEEEGAGGRKSSRPGRHQLSESLWSRGEVGLCVVRGVEHLQCTDPTCGITT